jgi:hypothetical protein
MRRGWSAWLGNNGQSSHDVRSGSLRLHRHKRCSPLDHGSRPKSFCHPPRCPYTVREASAWCVSACQLRRVVRRFVFPPFLACPRSSRGVDLLVVHNYLLVLYHNGTHLHSWHSDFFLWLLLSTKPALDFTTHCDHSGTFPRCVCGRYYRFCTLHHN